MKGKSVFLLLIVGLLSGLLVNYVKSANDIANLPIEGYRVYLEGKTIGYIKSRDELNEYINSQQEKLKEKYNVEQIYVPNNIDVVKELTYESNINDVASIYNMINTISPFTIKGYQVTIDRTKSTEYKNDDNDDDKKPKIIKLNVINKEVFTEAIEEVILSFIDQDQYDNFKAQQVVELNGDTGELIENIYIEDNITIKETNIPVNEIIYMKSSDLTQYLIFGGNTVDRKYKVKNGDSIDKIAETNRMSVNELVIANKDLASKNALIYIGQELSVGGVDPIVTMIVEKHIVEDRVIKAKTVYQYDNTMYQGQSKTKQNGSDGVTRVTQKVKMMNGEIINAYIVSSEEITPVVNKIVIKGGKQTPRGDGEWTWPTNFPYMITSRYGYRWGKLHSGIDIAGVGRGSPVYAARAGVVTAIAQNSSSGFYVIIKHDNGYYTRYAHMQNTAWNDKLSGTHSATKYISVGDRVSAHQVIGEVGSSGTSSGVHCHFEIWNGPPWQSQSFNPLLFY